MLRFAPYRTVRGFAQHDNGVFFSNLLLEPYRNRDRIRGLNSDEENSGAIASIARLGYDGLGSGDIQFRFISNT